MRGKGHPKEATRISIRRGGCWPWTPTGAIRVPCGLFALAWCQSVCGRFPPVAAGPS